ncbi:PASTA domain-containing protein [Peptoniphilus sp. MSJ-1]|uniref:PASTA domain-containing protein n=1 Tax=Peptoniphilus ovalis TaxID=2841503 RepID=A0ABS6FIN1_9FIRM|nr:penicillin-binding transpeptidase domain-containing protein [Peptoniphilus ovalis]MBU5669091.1 PASTA domain-containing protein [Peptoniphilus ovalis]
MKNNNDKARDKKLKNGFYKSFNRANKSIFWFFILLAFLFGALVVKLLHIQIVQSEELTISALNQLTRTETINSNRGIIYDRNKKELAINTTKSNVFYNMDVLDQRQNESLTDFNDRKKKLFDEDAKLISDVLGEDYEEIREKFKGDKVVRIATNVDKMKANKLRELRTQLANEKEEGSKEKKKNLSAMSIDDVTRRLYPFNNLASYIIGFTNDENMGQYGIEASYDEELTGIPGKNVSLKDNASNKIPLTDEETYAPKEGYSIVLSIDANIQQFAETAAENAKKENKADKVSIIVQDTMTGEIIAMTTKDDYNLNDPKKPINEEQEKNWDEYTDEEKTKIWYDNWRDFNINDQYEPGSTFKVITTAAAIEQNVAQPDSIFTCNGSMRVGDRTLTCTSHTRGPKTLAKAIEESCNMTLIQVGNELGKEELLRYIKAFGFGKKTGIELYGESTGIIPRSADEISAVNLATMSYGHSIAVSPIQLVNAVSAICNGGYLNKPTIFKEAIDANGNIIEKNKTQLRRRVISQETSEKMKYMMKKVVENGTGKLAAVDGYQVGGKSGTANIATPTGYLDAYNSSFVGVAPLNDPRLTVLVVINNPKNGILGGAVAAPVVSEVLNKSLNYLKIQKTEEIKSEENYVTVPEVEGLLLEDAGRKILNNKLKFNINTDKGLDYAVVTNQNPSAGSYVLEDSIIDLAVNDNLGAEKVMPNLSKMTRKEVESILNYMNLEYNIKGNGDFISQAPKAGTKVDSSTRVTVNYANNDDNLKKEPTEEKNIVSNNEDRSTKNNNVNKNKDKDKDNKN